MNVVTEKTEEGLESHFRNREIIGGLFVALLVGVAGSVVTTQVTQAETKARLQAVEEKIEQAQQDIRADRDAIARLETKIDMMLDFWKIDYQNGKEGK